MVALSGPAASGPGQEGNAGASAREVSDKMFETLPLLMRTLRQDQFNVRGNYQRLHVLKLLVRCPQTQAKLSEYLEVNPSVMSKLIDNLEQRDLVTRTIDPEDRRRMVITLTDGGREFQRKMRVQLRERICRSLKTLTPTERKTLADALDIVKNLIEPDQKKER